MLSVVRFGSRNLQKSCGIPQQIAGVRCQSTKYNQAVDAVEKPRKFRVLQLNRNSEQKREVRVKRVQAPTEPRYKKMSVTQNWGNVWPGPRSFHPAVVPLPIRQGYQSKSTNIVPDKFANAELMKIPNFLHLTPPVVKRQCEALKKFCTPWPKGLETDEKCEEHFPIEYISTDYCHGLPTIRNPLSRIITLRIKLSKLPLDQHAKDKLLRLVEKRYDPKTDYITLAVDRCPLRQQNFEYAQYLLTALFHESYVVEPWEAMKTEADMEYYDWNRNKSKETIGEILNYSATGSSSEKVDLDSNKEVQEYARSVEKYLNEGENSENIKYYKDSVLAVLGLKV